MNADFKNGSDENCLSAFIRVHRRPICLLAWPQFQRELPIQDTSYFALSILANSRYAPGTPAGNSRNQLNDEKMKTPLP